MAQTWHPELRPASTKWIAGRVMTLLSHYYQPNQTDAVAEAVIIDWVNILREFTQDQIERACRAYMEEFPRYRPGPGDIKRRIQKVALAHEPGGFTAKALPPPEQKVDRVSAEKAQEILSAFRFDPERGFRTTQTDDAEKATKEVKWTCETNAERLRAARMNNPLMREGMTDD